MSQNQAGRDTSDDAGRRTRELVMAETLRSASQSSRGTEKHPEKSGKPDDEKVSLFWRVFGGTILSVVALGLITLYNNLTSNIAELRAELSKEREVRAGLVKKDDFQAGNQRLYERMRTAEGMKADIEALKERSHGNAVAIEAVKKDTAAAVDVVRKDTNGLEVLKERVGAVEGLKKEVAGVELLKERLATVTADLKTARDDVQKLQQELEKNKTADLERKAARDAQAKQQDEAFKELQKTVQDCREKLARLEGPAIPFVGPPVPKEIKAVNPKR